MSPPAGPGLGNFNPRVPPNPPLPDGIPVASHPAALTGLTPVMTDMSVMGL